MAVARPVVMERAGTVRCFMSPTGDPRRHEVETVMVTVGPLEACVCSTGGHRHSFCASPSPDASTGYRGR